MRNLDTYTLDGASQHLVEEFDRSSVVNKDGRFISGRSYVMQDLYNFTFKDEFDYIVDSMRVLFDQDQLKEFDRQAVKKFSPRSDSVLEELLAKKLAIDLDGHHIEGLVGTTVVGSRVVGKRIKKIQKYFDKSFIDHMLGRPHGKLMYEKTLVKNEYWPVYTGELQERASGLSMGGILDELPDGAQPFIEELYANNPRISNECAILACDAIVDNFDEGAGAAVIEGRSGAQPADPDTAVAGTLGFTLVCSSTAFGAASDDTGKATATAASITDDTSAAATITLGYCRLSSTTDGLNPIDDHLDGEAGTSGADFNFNTLSIVSGATVSLTSMTVSVPES